MTGSGLEELFEEVYAEHTVKHMISGKAVARSLRAHMMAQSSLVAHLIDILVDNGKVYVMEFESMYTKAENGELSFAELEEFDEGSTVQQFNKEFNSLAASLEKTSRTAKLWLQYIEYIDVVKELICAERTSNWKLHLQAIRKMVNLFAATGHVNYGRSSRMYHQEMLTLLQKYPYLFHQFQEGNHAIRRSQRYWAGLSSDLVIEQTLMRSIKSRGGLTRGRGMVENTRHLWVSSISYTAAVHEAMTNLSGVKVASSEQHLEMGCKRRKRDFEDGKKFYRWFETRNPFTYKDCDLHSLSLGTVSIDGKDNVNCENAEAIGKRIQTYLNGVIFTNAKKRSSSTSSGIKENFKD